MQLTTLAYGLLALFASQVSATALTYKLVANEKACFYANNQDKGQKIAFYFAVRPALRHSACSRSGADPRFRYNPEALSMSTFRSPPRRAR